MSKSIYLNYFSTLIHLSSLKYVAIQSFDVSFLFNIVIRGRKINELIHVYIVKVLIQKS
jgi:hypothetical protein